MLGKGMLGKASLVSEDALNIQRQCNSLSSSPPQSISQALVYSPRVELSTKEPAAMALIDTKP